MNLSGVCPTSQSPLLIWKAPAPLGVGGSRSKLWKGMGARWAFHDCCFPLLTGQAGPALGSPHPKVAPEHTSTLIWARGFREERLQVLDSKMLKMVEVGVIYILTREGARVQAPRQWELFLWTPPASRWAQGPGWGAEACQRPLRYLNW